MGELGAVQKAKRDLERAALGNQAKKDSPFDLLDSLTARPSVRVLATIRRLCKDEQWASVFVCEGGVKLLLDAVVVRAQGGGKSLPDLLIQICALKCLLAIVGHRSGMDELRTTPDNAFLLLECLLAAFTNVQCVLLSLLTAIASARDRPEWLLMAFDKFHDHQLKSDQAVLVANVSDRSGFQVLLNVWDDEVPPDDASAAKFEILRLLNTLVGSQEALATRVDLRQRLVALGFLDRARQCPEVKRQREGPLLNEYRQFLEGMARDGKKLREDINTDITDPLQLFSAVLAQAHTTEQQEQVLALLNLLFQLPIENNDAALRGLKGLAYLLKTQAYANVQEDDGVVPSRPTARGQRDLRGDLTARLSEKLTSRRQASAVPPLQPPSARRERPEVVPPQPTPPQTPEERHDPPRRKSSGKPMPPPPPPPPAPMAPPPPPPPPGVGVGRIPLPPPAPGVKKDAAISVVKAGRPMKVLDWTKVPAGRLDGTVWQQHGHDLDEAGVDLDWNKMEKLFGQAKRQKSFKRSEGKGPKQPTHEYLLDHRRSMNVAITLSQFGQMPHESIVHAVRVCDLDAFGTDGVELLRSVLPKPDEMATIAEYKGDPAKLAPADRFMHMLSHVESVHLRLEAMRLRKRLHESQAEVEARVQTVIDACVALQESDRFHRFLLLLRKLGNKLNESSYRGSARGFDLSVLSRLGSIRSNRRALPSLLHHSLHLLERKEPHFASKLLRDLRDAPSVAQWKISQLAQDARELAEDTQRTSASLKAIPDLGELAAFFARAAEDIRPLPGQVDSAAKLVERAQAFYGMRNAKPDEFFALLSAFHSEVARAGQDLARSKSERLQRCRQLIVAAAGDNDAKNQALQRWRFKASISEETHMAMRERVRKIRHRASMSFTEKDFEEGWGGGDASSSDGEQSHEGNNNSNNGHGQGS